LSGELREDFEGARKEGAGLGMGVGSKGGGGIEKKGNERLILVHD